MRLDAHAVTRRFRDGGSVGPVSLKLAEHELVALVGASGSGKTTLLTLLGGLASPQSGTICIDGEQARMSQLRSRCVWVSQGANALPSRSALDNVSIGVLSGGVSRREAVYAASEALNVLGLAHRLSTAARDLSGGELQRIAVARAMCSNRPIVLADEPTGNLDHENTALVIRAFRLLVTRGRHAAVIATHDPAVAAAADRVVDLAQVIAMSSEVGP